MPQNGIQQVVYHHDAHEDGGLCCNNDELLNEQRKAIMEWIKSMGQRLLTGNINLINTPFPVVMFEPRSYLEKLADVWVYPKYLAKAAAATNPVERMKWTITWFIAGLHHGFEKWKKPFNPILGETWQARLSDGSSIAMEQISHHPPISAFHLTGPHGAYSFVGLSQPCVTLQLTQRGFKTVAKGFRYVQFADGSKIEMTYPSYSINGVVNATRPCAEVEGKAGFVDALHNLQAVISFGAVKGAASPLLKRSDAVTGSIMVYENGKGSSMPPPPRQSSPGVSSDDEFASASENEYDGDEDRDTARASTTGKGPGVDDANWPESLVVRPADPERPPLAFAPAASARYDPPAKLLPSLLPKSASGKDISNPGSLTAVSTTSSSSSSSMFGMKKLSKMFGFMGTSSTSSVDEVQGQGNVLASVEGSWLSHLNIGGDRTWTLVDETPDRWEAVPDALPSDSRYRMDLAVLKSGDVKGAQEWKERLEHEQRTDKKLRNKGH